MHTCTRAHTELEAATSFPTQTYTHTPGVAAWPWPRKKAQMSLPLVCPDRAQGHLPVCGLSPPDPTSPKRPQCDSSVLESGESTWVLPVPGSLPTPSGPAP